MSLVERLGRFSKEFPDAHLALTNGDGIFVSELCQAMIEAKKIMVTLGGFADTDYTLMDIVNMCAEWNKKYSGGWE